MPELSCLSACAEEKLWPEEQGLLSQQPSVFFQRFYFLEEHYVTLPTHSVQTSHRRKAWHKAGRRISIPVAVITLFLGNEDSIPKDGWGSPEPH
jgi:hypothetical protein